MRTLYIGPSCQMPPMDGASRRIWNLFDASIGKAREGAFVGATVTEVDGARSSREPSSSWRNDKIIAGFASLLSARDYWETRFVDRGIRRAVHEIGRGRLDGVVVNFLYATPLLSELGQRKIRLIVDTHNYDPMLYADFRDASKNPVVRHLAGRAIRSSAKNLRRLPEGTTMVHVSDADSRRWQEDRPDLRHEVVENGCALRPRRSTPDYSMSMTRLLFVGSLSAQMNEDGLSYFADVFWPLLRASSQLLVVGSNPSSKVKELCKRCGWELRADVTEDELDTVYARSHFAILPFKYAAGSKLKLFEAIGRGIPVLTTQAGIVGTADLPRVVNVSETPEEWLRQMRSKEALSAPHLEESLAFAATKTWAAMGRRLRRIIEGAEMADLDW